MQPAVCPKEIRTADKQENRNKEAQYQIERRSTQCGNAQRPLLEQSSLVQITHRNKRTILARKNPNNKSHRDSVHEAFDVETEEKKGHRAKFREGWFRREVRHSAPS